MNVKNLAERAVCTHNLELDLANLAFCTENFFQLVSTLACGQNPNCQMTPTGR